MQLAPLVVHREFQHHRLCSINADFGNSTVVIIFAPLTLVHVMAAIYVRGLKISPTRY